METRLSELCHAYLITYPVAAYFVNLYKVLISDNPALSVTLTISYNFAYSNLFSLWLARMFTLEIYQTIFCDYWMAFLIVVI